MDDRRYPAECDQAEGHRQDDQDGLRSIGDHLDDELLRCLWAERDGAA